MKTALEQWQEDIDNFPLGHSYICRSYPNGNNVTITHKDGHYYPRYADGTNWAYYYIHEYPTPFGHITSPIRTSFKTKDAAIDFLTGELLRAYNEREEEIWP